MSGPLSRAVVESIVREVIIRRLGEPRCAVAGGSAAPLAVNASARHLHISQEHLDRLFGPGYQLTPFRPLHQEGHFAAKETVTLIGPRSRVLSNLRIHGPVRHETQIELAYTDAIGLGIEDVPVRLSGDVSGTPGACIMGPAGMVELKEGIIRAAIHVHMGPADAADYGVKHLDVMKLRIGGAAGITFDRVHVRVDPTHRLEVHMDTDQANACGLHLGPEVELYRQ